MGIVVGERGRPPSAPEGGEAHSRRRRRLLGLAWLLVSLLVLVVASLAVGARALTPAEVWHGLFGTPGTDQRLTEITLIVQTLRVPRTVLAVVAGVALGVAGALIQGHT